MRELADPRAAAPDVSLLLHAERLGAAGSAGNVESGEDSDRLARRDRVLHYLEVSRRRRRRPQLRPA